MHKSQPRRSDGSVIVEADILVVLLTADPVGLTACRPYFDRHKLPQLFLNRITVDVLSVAGDVPGFLGVAEVVEDTDPRIHWRLDHFQPRQSVGHVIDDFGVVGIVVVEVF